MELNDKVIADTATLNALKVVLDNLSDRFYNNPTEGNNMWGLAKTAHSLTQSLEVPPANMLLTPYFEHLVDLVNALNFTPENSEKIDDLLMMAKIYMISMAEDIVKNYA